MNKIVKKTILPILLISLLIIVFLPSITTGETASKLSTNSDNVTPLTDPSKAYIAPDFYKQMSAPHTDNFPERNPPHKVYSADELQKAQELIDSNMTLKRAINEATANPNILMTDKSTRDIIEQIGKSTDTIAPSDHSMWGASIAYGESIYGGFAQQYFSPNLNLGSTPNEDKVLYAPTMVLAQPCPVEVSTRYFYTASNNYNYGQEVRVFDFWQWQCGSGNGWTNVAFSITNTTYVFDAGTSHPYYYVEINYFSGQGWNVYFWNRNVNDWELMYNEPNGYLDYLENVRFLHGWDSFEAIRSSDDGGYDNSWAGVNIYNPIESSSLMVYWQDQYGLYHWNYNTWDYGGSAMNRWSNTPFSLTHYFANQYYHWIVRTPMVYIDAYDTTYYASVSAGVYIDNNYAGPTGSSYYLTPNVQHTISVDSYGYSSMWGQTVYFNSWSTGEMTTSYQTTVCGSDTSNTAYYDF